MGSLEMASLCLILFAVIIIVWGIAVVHTLPGKIAKKRNHSQVEAIEITSYLGLLVFPLWMAALIWAYLVPVTLKAAVAVEKDEKGGEGGTENDLKVTVQVGDAPVDDKGGEV